VIEEPYRWVEAIANRREYIEHQLAGGSPIVGLSFPGGILLVTLSRERQKIFEIYDRIAMGGIGHPGDIERLRMTAIEVTSTEGFTRSPDDVSLRRLASYSISPVLKGAFEQIYGAPFLARLLFTEVGSEKTEDLFVRLDYDGSMRSSGGSFAREQAGFGVLGASEVSEDAMRRFLRGSQEAHDLPAALSLALDAWAVGRLCGGSGETSGDLPTSETIASHLAENRAHATVEAALLERSVRGGAAIAYRILSDEELNSLQGKGKD
jgi:proteasome alpha subunit